MTVSRLVSVVAVAAVPILSIDPASAQDHTMRRLPAALAVMQFTGVGQLEGAAAGDRFQGRFAILSLDGAEESIFGPDVSLFHAPCVEQHGSGIQCAHLVGVLSGSLLESFITAIPGASSDPAAPEFLGHLAVRSAASERFRVYYHAKPNGSASFEDLDSLQTGELVAVYKVREYVTVDPITQTFMSRGIIEIVESAPFTLNGITTDMGRIAPRLTFITHGRAPEPRTTPLLIPLDDPAFRDRGPGAFIARYAVSGLGIAVANGGGR